MFVFEGKPPVFGVLSCGDKPGLGLCTWTLLSFRFLPLGQVHNGAESGIWVQSGGLPPAACGESKIAMFCVLRKSGVVSACLVYAASL